jgi:hypothetical protein
MYIERMATKSIMAWRENAGETIHGSDIFGSDRVSCAMQEGTMTSTILGICLAVLVLATVGTPAMAADISDYPTAARADYVYACMKANGETRQVLDQCSCSIDVIASVLPYDRYVTAETALSLSQVPGRFGAMFRSPEEPKAAIGDLRRAQAEAEVRCF